MKHPVKSKENRLTKPRAGAEKLETSSAKTQLSAGRAQLLLLFTVTALTLWPLCGGEFTSWDDPTTVSNNPTLNPPTLHSLKVWWTTARLDLWDPVTDMLRGALALVGTTASPDPVTGTRLNPYVYHTANLLLHIATVLIVFQILVLILRREGKPVLDPEVQTRRPPRITIQWAACAGALLFAVHPLQVESVGWVTAMKDLLCGLLCLAALWRYLLYASSDDSPRPLREFWLATLLYVLATLSKPTAVVLPVIVLVLNQWVLRRPLRQVWRGMLLWAVLALPCIIATKLAQPAVEIAAVSPWQRPLVAADALAFYLYKLVWPATLGLDYGRRPDWIFQHGFVWWTWLAPATLAILLFIFRRRAPLLVAAAMIFVLGLLPVLGFVRFDFQQYSTVSDHYLYLSMFGVALAGAWVVARLGPSKTVLVGVSLLIGALGLRSWQQSWVWRNSETVFVHAIKVNPTSVAGYASLSELEWRRGMNGEAEALARTIVRLRPDLAGAYVPLAELFEHQGRIDEAIAVCRAACAAEPDMAVGYLNLSLLLARRGELTEAEAVVRRALELQPDSADAYLSLGVLEIRQNRLEAGKRDLRTAVSLDPYNALARTNFGALLARQGRREDATAQFRAALRIDPDFAPARRGLDALMPGDRN